jgi:hypothetical protein
MHSRSVDTRSVPRASGLVLTGLSESDPRAQSLDGMTTVTSSPWMRALLMMPIARCEVATHTTHEVPNFIVMDTVVILKVYPRD